MIWLAFYSERFSAMEITDVIERGVQDRLQTIPGVSEVLIRGARTYAELPAEAVKYIRRIEELVEAPVVLLSTSPERDDTIMMRDPFAG